ncbi:MAG TPA: hypothetical protein DD390_05290 [Rhodospirillaceae bacterium]|nr:hypothetical protein [Rhodospirillaceae bacterium]HBM12089.1 hypothetical protein [Rhodospirillaceae bacterium]|tara:strand:- start:9956 stop:10795 length:840 start_codon:yes stop_codon:yes gene_type:complete
MKYSLSQFRANHAPFTLAGMILVGALFLFARPALSESVFEAPFEPAKCGERLNRLYDGDFDQFWNYVLRQGYTGVSEFAWSTPEMPGESSEEWRVRAYQCVLEVERANHHDDRPEIQYALGYFLWFGTTSLGYDKEPDGKPGIRERGYRLLSETAADGYKPAKETIIQVHLEMVQSVDQRIAYAARAGKTVTLPDWWPDRDRLILSLDRAAKSGFSSAYLAISSIYSERALLVGATGHDHNGNPATSPDPRLISAAKAYRKAWEENRTAPVTPAPSPAT